MTGISKLPFLPVPAYFCYGWVKSPLYKDRETYLYIWKQRNTYFKTEKHQYKDREKHKSKNRTHIIQDGETFRFTKRSGKDAPTSYF